MQSYIVSLHRMNKLERSLRLSHSSIMLMRHRTSSGLGFLDVWPSLQFLLLSSQMESGGAWKQIFIVLL